MRWFALLLAVAAGCTTANNNCSLGDHRSCTCSDGTVGEQVCLANGYGSCNCVLGPTFDLSMPNNNQMSTPDMSMSSSNPDLSMSSSNPDLTMINTNADLSSAACATYTQTSIASMRQSGTNSGCFELDNVVSIALHASTTNPRLYVQDAAGGSFSAIQTHCSATSATHPCSQAATVNTIATGHQVTVRGRWTRSPTTSYEAFYIDTISDNGAATMPAALALQPGDVARGAYSAANVFQRVAVSISAADTLTMYDWSPAEFTIATGNAATCHPPFQIGFGMIPSSVTPTTAAGTACTATGMTGSQPTAVVNPDAHEILIGTDFFSSGFIAMSDCRCAATLMDKLVTASSTLTGSLSGILTFEVPLNATVGYQYVAPQSMSDAAITNLQ
jgi:hypothetical protein